MYHLAYFSVATQRFSVEDLEELLVVSKRNNEAVGVTGVLLYIEGCFLQILEGEEEAVKEVFARVKADTRHEGLLIIFEGAKARRNFDKWSMGFKNMPMDTYKRQIGFEDISDEAFVENVLKKFHPKVARTLDIFYRGGM